MISIKTKNKIITQKFSILWLSSMILDTSIQKNSLLDILQGISELGHDVSLIAMRSKSIDKARNLQTQIFSIPLRHIPLFSRFMFSVALFLSLPFLIIISNPDFIIMDSYIPIFGSFSGLFFSKLKKTKFILDIRTTPVETAGFRGSMLNFLFSTSILVAKKLFNGITILTPLMKKEVCCNFDLNPKNVGVWTSGVSKNLFDAQKVVSESAELKTKMGLSGKFVVLYHGVLTATRGLQESIKAIEILKQKHPDVVLLFLGAGPVVPMLRFMVSEKNLQDNVIIHDPVEQSIVPQYIGFCDAGIVPLPNNSYWRFQSPLKLLEYLSMEKIVIVSDIPAHRALIGETKCGVYFSSVKPVEIAKAIEYVYCNKQHLEKWGKIGREIVKKEYTWEKVAKDLENYLLSIK